MNPRAWPTRLRRTQLRTRVTAGVLMVTLALLAVLGDAAVTMIHQYLLASTDANLKTVIAEYEPLIVSSQIVPPARRPSGPARQYTGTVTIPAFLDQYSVFRIRDKLPQEIVRGNPELVPRFPADLTALAARDGSQTVLSSTGHTQLLLLAVSGPGGTVAVTTSLESVNTTTSRFTVIIVCCLLATGLIVSTGVGLVVRRGLRPIETIAATADKITAGDLTIRVGPDEPGTEVGRLGTALNGMLTRIQAAVDERKAHEQAMRQFFADASHELRTPLASLRANAEVYQQGALPHRAQVDEAMRRIASEARRMGTLVDDMLRLARLDQHPRQDHKPVGLTALITECADRARIASPDRSWHARIAPGLVTDGDEEMLRRAIDNLLANIVTHTPPGTTATILGTATGTAITIEVEDDGPGVQASQLSRIFDRFYQAPARARTHGSGLGLAIVAAIAAAHDGTVQATLNHPHGLRITLALPVSSQPGTSRYTPGTPASPPTPATPAMADQAGRPSPPTLARLTSRPRPGHGPALQAGWRWPAPRLSSRRAAGASSWPAAAGLPRSQAILLG